MYRTKTCLLYTSIRKTRLNQNIKQKKSDLMRKRELKNMEWGIPVSYTHLDVYKRQEEIYTTNKAQSTTHNATGVYDLNGEAWERTRCV